MTVNFILAGAGTVGQSFLRLLQTESDRLQQQNISLRLVGVCDSSGILADPYGIDIAKVLEAKKAGHIADLPGSIAHAGPESLLNAAADGAHIFIDCLPGGNLKFASLALKALNRKLHVVSARKDHLVMLPQYHREFSVQNHRQLRFSAAVNAGLPGSLELGQALAKAGELIGFRAVLSSTCSMILHKMGSGMSYEEALALAQKMGLAETDPTGDVSGSDAALKTVLYHNAFWEEDIPLQQVEAVSVDTAPVQTGEMWRYVALCRPAENIFRVSPQKLEPDDLLYPLGPRDKAIIFETATQGELFFRAKDGTGGTAGTLLADVLTVIKDMVE